MIRVMLEYARDDTTTCVYGSSRFLSKKRDVSDGQTGIRQLIAKFRFDMCV